MLLGRHLLSTVWLYARDTEGTKRFYRDVLGMDLFDEHDGTAHFDGGGIRLSLHPAKGAEGWGFLVFLVEEGIEGVCRELASRGVAFVDELQEESFGKAASLRDPEGNLLFVWQPPPPDDPRFAQVEALVAHYRGIEACLRRSGGGGRRENR